MEPIFGGEDNTCSSQLTIHSFPLDLIFFFDSYLNRKLTANRRGHWEVFPTLQLDSHAGSNSFCDQYKKKEIKSIDLHFQNSINSSWTIDTV